MLRSLASILARYDGAAELDRSLHTLLAGLDSSSPPSQAPPAAEATRPRSSYPVPRDPPRGRTRVEVAGRGISETCSVASARGQRHPGMKTSRGQEMSRALLRLGAPHSSPGGEQRP